MKMIYNIFCNYLAGFFTLIIKLLPQSPSPMEKP